GHGDVPHVDGDRREGGGRGYAHRRALAHGRVPRHLRGDGRRPEAHAGAPASPRVGGRPRGSGGRRGASPREAGKTMSANGGAMAISEVHIGDLRNHVGQEVTLRGWLYNRRSSGKLHFLEVRDGTGIVQCVVFKGNVSPETFARADHIQQESSLE